MGRCRLCRASSPFISSRLGVCLDCIRRDPDLATMRTDRVHAESRVSLGLPAVVPRNKDGLPCGTCANLCLLGPGDHGYCGLVHNVEDTLLRSGGTPEKGVLEWYYDKLPTNCVSAWFCPGCTGNGYPKYSCSELGPEVGFSNLAVFYGACGFDCLYCQNWHYRKMSAALSPVFSAEDLAARAGRNVTCVCYFGGDPSPQMPHALETSKLAVEIASNEDRIIRICWETNGAMNEQFALGAAQLSLSSGGNVKFDLKFASEELNRALCGVSNESTLKNFERIGRLYSKRPELPLISASTLLVPGYVDSIEIERIANLIAEVDTKMPYSLLAFYPHYLMNDLPTTDRKMAMLCLESARKQGLENVRLGNVHLLS